MKIHEYQAKELFSRYGIPVPRGLLVRSAGESALAAESFGGRAVVKAQIHAGGRGKAGGIRMAHSPEEASLLYEQLLGSRLVTAQTGPGGSLVRKIYVEAPVESERELYLALLFDRKASRACFLASAEGGTEIEEANGAAARVGIDPALGPTAYALRNLASALRLFGRAQGEFLRMAHNLYRLFRELDASLVEINPLALLADESLMALDAKIVFDDNALFRHPDIARLRDPEQEDPRESEAAKYGLSYVGLDGAIGCLVNGAGLAMATLDAIALRGGRAANFLDIGGGVREEGATEAFRLLLGDPKARAILVNVFGGIVRCDVVASGMVRALEKVKRVPPVVVRLSGNRAEEGKNLLKSARPAEGHALDIRFAQNIDDAARLAVDLAMR
jgi:succinyl-CoA synthetase beta subunit